MKFDKQQSEYNLTELKMNHNFALKMASIVSWAVISAISILSIFYGNITKLSLSILIILIIAFGIITFSTTRRACL